MSTNTKNAQTTEYLDHTVNIAEFTTIEAIEAESKLIATTLDRAVGKVKEQTIMGKTNVGLFVWRECQLAVAADDTGKMAMPDVKVATIGKLSKLIGLSDDPGKRADGTTIPDAADRFGYRMGTLGACIDLARGVIAGVDKDARRKLIDDGVDVNERDLRSAILAKLNPNLIQSRRKGAENLAAAKLALAAGLQPGSIVKVGTTVNSKGKTVGGKAVTIDAEVLNKVKNTTSDATIDDATIATWTTAQLVANIAKLQLVKAARDAGTIAAPVKAAKQ